MHLGCSRRQETGKNILGGRVLRSTRVVAIFTALVEMASP